jgi:hypothetical protein
VLVLLPVVLLLLVLMEMQRAWGQLHHPPAA